MVRAWPRFCPQKGLLTLSQQYAEEKEMLELQCMSLRKDSQMYKKRIEAVLQQMEEVALERDQVKSTPLELLLIPASLLEVGRCCNSESECCNRVSSLLQALLTREQFYAQYSKNLVERDTYRKQIRELGERCDELQLQLFQKESQLLATEAKLKRLQLELPTPVRLRGGHLSGGLGS